MYVRWSSVQGKRGLFFFPVIGACSSIADTVGLETSLDEELLDMSEKFEVEERTDEGENPSIICTYSMWHRVAEFALSIHKAHAMVVDPL
jgi:hypothetical protein